MEELALRQLSPRPPARRPPPPPPVPLGAWPSLLPEAVACLFALLIQVTIWCRTASGLVLRGHLHQAMICAGFVGSYCIATSAAYTQSRFWQRCRWAGGREEGQQQAGTLSEILGCLLYMQRAFGTVNRLSPSDLFVPLLRPVVITTLRLLLCTVPANRSSTVSLFSTPSLSSGRFHGCRCLDVPQCRAGTPCACSKTPYPGCSPPSHPAGGPGIAAAPQRHARRAGGCARLLSLRHRCAWHASWCRVALAA